MEKNWIVLLIFVIATIAVIITVLKKNYKDRKGLFKKLTGDYPEPTIVESEFDRKK
jgi:hypothetical protein